jgi:CubicO group peptidase (beta-lactamase class C family)
MSERTGSPPRAPSPAIESLQDCLAQAVERKLTPGLVVRVEALTGGRDGQGARISSFEWSTGLRAWEPAPEPLTADTVYDCASLTKVVVTAPVFARLFDSGAAQPDTPVARLLPGFRADRTGQERITLRHLLTHTSGLPAGLPLGEPWEGPQAAWRLACAAQPTHAPGLFFRYSDINFILLGAVAETITGQPLDALAQAWLFGPLGMRDSGFRPVAAPERWAAVPMARVAPTEWEGEIGAPSDTRPRNARLLRGVVHDPTARRMGGVAGHAGLFSTAADLGRYARMLLLGGELDGVRVLSRASVDRMWAVATPNSLAERRSLGWDIDSPLSRARGLPGQGWSAGSIGHTGFTGCALWIDPTLRAFHVLLSNRVHPIARESIVGVYEAVATAAAQMVREGAMEGPARARGVAS